ncbi:sensor histidine kinase [Wenxinia marina]|uniref:histidine kinase n=1 Tax=Wenxinia marina DSM 24838 TaxID=1123501 RepID=A0A0D0P7B0_9RHOB|nr:sensor histidine kinase [Wenxinia marina]KIQ67476.1 Signal transduction histidine kinase [Wenxinia marina DSM 24838]GGL69216.1 histidine kinase [Wenxinia marina]
MTTAPGRPLRRFFDKLGVQLSLSVAVALLPLGVIALLQTLAVIREAQGRSQAALMGVTLRAASREVRLLSEAQGVAAGLAATVSDILDDPEACSAAMRRVADPNPEFAFIGYIPNDGMIECSTAEGPVDATGSVGYGQFRNSDQPMFYINPRGAVSGVSIVGVTNPVRDDAGTRIGWISISVPQATLAARDPLTNLDLPVERSVTLVTFDGEGRFLTSSVPTDIAQEMLPSDRSLQLLAGAEPLSFTGIAVDGEERVYSVVPIVNGRLYAMGSWPRGLAELDLSSSLSPLLLPVAMWLCGLFVAWFAANRLILRHIGGLRRSMGLFAGGGRIVGDLRTETAPREIREVSDAFVRMTDTILRDEAELEDMIHQKEVLLREVHHRVKNNLQLIASIMNLQMRTARSPEAKRLIRGLQERVMSLATVHKELYQTSGLTTIHAEELLSEIVQQIVRLSTAPGRPIDLQTDFAPLRLLPDQAVPLSLFVTEALTNAMKYAGLGLEATPSLRVSLCRDEEDGPARLEISNSLPAPGADTADLDGGTGLGARLLSAFAVQVGGTYETVKTDDAYRVTLMFRPAAVPDLDPEEE